MGTGGQRKPGPGFSQISLTSGTEIFVAMQKQPMETAQNISKTHHTLTPPYLLLAPCLELSGQLISEFLALKEGLVIESGSVTTHGFSAAVDVGFFGVIANLSHGNFLR